MSQSKKAHKRAEREAAAAKLDRDRYRSELGARGAAYYAVGRFSIRHGLLPVCGNLLHQAVELFLKAVLVKRGTPLLDLPDIFGHDLTRLWTTVAAGDSTLAGHEATIASLDPLIELRYPDSVLSVGATIAVGPRDLGSLRPSFPPGAQVPPHYEIDLEMVDALVALLIKLASLSAIDLIAFKRAEVLAEILYDNSHAACWEIPAAHIQVLPVPTSSDC